MFKGKRIGAILLMGGSGSRFGASTPKQFLPLADKPLFAHALETLRTSALFDEIILVSHPSWHTLDVPEKIVKGGQSRQESSHLGLLSFTQPPDIVLIHDAVRPFVSIEILQNNIVAALLHGAADTCIPSADTLVYAPDGTITDIPNRTHFARGQTPQTFRYDWILQAHKQAQIDGIENASDDCKLILRLGKPIQLVPGSEYNIKITTELDLLIAEQIALSFDKNGSYTTTINQKKEGTFMIHIEASNHSVYRLGDQTTEDIHAPQPLEKEHSLKNMGTHSQQQSKPPLLLEREVMLSKIATANGISLIDAALLYHAQLDEQRAKREADEIQKIMNNEGVSQTVATSKHKAIQEQREEEEVVQSIMQQKGVSRDVAEAEYRALS